MTSQYLEEPDTDSDNEVVCTLTEDEIHEIKEQNTALKNEGNQYFSEQKYDLAIERYTTILRTLKANNLPLDDVILTNRSAANMAIKKYVPASHDALQAAKINPNNWKAHWRHAISLLEMVPKRFRTKQAITALETCAQCPTLPEGKMKEIQDKLRFANARLAQQDADTPMPDMSNCAPS